VAVFNDDQTGEWVPLTPETTGMDRGRNRGLHPHGGLGRQRHHDGPPRVDRRQPDRTEAYCCLTNNSRRGLINDDGTVRTNAGGEPMTVNGPNPRDINRYGQIVRWRPAGGDHGATTFDWDLYVMVGNPTVHDDAYAGSANMNAGNLFNSPDGMMIDTTGLIWIQTDGNDGNEGDFEGHGQQPDARGRPGDG
jgi:secreted PhoX family phosphatase